MNSEIKQPLSLIHRGKGEGKDYAWGKDHIFVKLSKAETGGALTLIQDNLKKGFNLGLHLHHKHTEIFYILDGEVDFIVSGQAIKAKTGSVIYIPEGTPHAASSSTGSQMLMFYTPGGFDEMLSEIENAPWFKRYNPFSAAKRNKKYDMNNLSGDEVSSSMKSRMLYLEPGEGSSFEDANGTRVIKLNSTQTKGLATVQEQTLNPGVELELENLNSGQFDILYVLHGEMEYVANNQTEVAKTGSTIYFPSGKKAKIKALNGVKLLSFRLLEDKR